MRPGLFLRVMVMMMVVVVVMALSEHGAGKHQ
jgi:hypothetical protein